jgi:RNA polymerase sigma-70 factor (sigma-E family)
MSDDLAFERFVHEHTTTLFGTAFLLTGDRYLAEELLQDTLVHLYPKWSKVTSAEVPIAYVRRCVANRYLGMRRAPAARTESSWELPDGWDGTDLSETVTTSRAVWQLLGTLPQKQRAALVMRYFDDLPEADVAAALGCRPASVRSLVSRGIAAMRAAYFATPAATEGSRS